MEMKRKLTDTYVKTFRVTSKVFTLEEVGFVISALGQAIMARVSDRAVIAQILPTSRPRRSNTSWPMTSRHEPPPTATPRTGVSNTPRRSHTPRKE